MKQKYTLIAALQQWIAQSPGLQFANYGCRKSYSSEYRAIQRDRRDAETLISAVASIPDITAENLAGSFRAFSGRLQWDGARLSYTTGQYWPTEYRKAACAVLAQALWDHFAKAPEAKNGKDIRKLAGAYLRNSGVVRRWFN
jgi:hypothetical protein